MRYAFLLLLRRPPLPGVDLTRRFTPTAHHRGQLTAAIRSWGLPLYSTYGPTADTGGLPKNGARVIYRGEADIALATIQPSRDVAFAIVTNIGADGLDLERSLSRLRPEIAAMAASR